MFQIVVSVSGGVTGSRSSVLKSDGVPVLFATRAEAEARAAAYLADRNGPYATATFGAVVEELEARRLRIVDVDMNGFCGRDHHPEPAMIGEVVTVVSSVVALTDEEADELRVEFGDGAPVLRLYTCRRADGSLVELVDFEVEPVVEEAL